MIDSVKFIKAIEMPQLSRVGMLMSSASLVAILSRPLAPIFNLATSIPATEGSNVSYLFSFDQLCDVVIIGGAQAGEFQLSDNFNTINPTITFFSQVYDSVTPANNINTVTLRATAKAGGLTTDHTLVVTVTDVASPIATSIPTVAGADTEGSILTATPAIWDQTVTVTGQWYRGSTPITDATALTYKRGPEDVGSGPKYRETATGVGGVSISNSADTAVTINGVILRLSMRATEQVDADRWTQTLTADGISTIVRTPNDGAGVGSYTWAFEGSIAYADTNGYIGPTYGSGHVAITGGSGILKIPVTAGVPIEMRLMLGAWAATGSTSFVVKNGSAGSEVARINTTDSIPSGFVCDHTGAIMTAADWNANAAVLSFTPTTNEIRIFKGTSSMFLRAVEITYPGALAATSGVGPYYISTTGLDSNNGKTIGAPWAHLAGDPAASGVLGAFDILPSGQMLLKRGQRHRPASYGSRTDHIQLRLNGTVGNPITIGAYDAGSSINPIVDGSEIIAGWVPALTGDVYANPNLANIQKKAISGVTSFRAQIFEGDKYLAPAQFPNPTCIYDFNRSYAGSDSFIFIPPGPADYDAKVHQGVNDSYLGVARECWIEDTAISAHYGAIDLTGYVLALFYAGRIIEFTIDSHNVGLGRLYFHINNQTYPINTVPDLFVSSPSSGWIYYCVRYHPFDVRKVGQYAWDLNKTTAFIHPEGSAERSVARISNGVTLNKNYIALNDLTIARMGTDTGRAIQSGAATVGLTINNLNISQVNFNGADWAMRFESAHPPTNFAFTNISMEDCPHLGIMTFGAGSNGTITGLRSRREGRSSIFWIGNINGGPHDIVLTDFDTSDNDDVHANGPSVYDWAHHITVQNGYSMNRPRGISCLADPIATQRSNVFKNLITTNKRPYPGALPPAGANYAWQGGVNEIGTLLEGVIIGDRMNIHPTAGKTASTGMIIRNCVINSLNAADLPGIHFENCVIFNEGGTGSGKTSLTGTGAIDDGGNDFTTPGNNWNGEITEQMQKALTRNIGGVGYTTRSLGHSAYPTIVPAWGTSFALADTKLTSYTMKVNHRVDDTFTSIVGMQPGSLHDLPAGVTDNDLFGLWRGQIYPKQNMSYATGTTFQITTRQTNTVHPDRTGPTTRDTVHTLVMV